ncbi:MAG: YXWGXW repeat-containing protein [Flavipsychrobacter sp.]|nr:YXWGXW repeat-containing protein [Flavipsychrobacter sp.]
MRNTAKAVFFALALTAVGTSVTSSAQIYVNIRPRHEVIVARPAPPSPRHVWVEEEWRPNHGHYEYAGGYWAAPPRPGVVWVPGHWRDTPRGSVWIAGHWR